MIDTENIQCEYRDRSPSQTQETNENFEIMEVKVIEVINNEIDDFQEESSDGLPYIETYPRNSFCREKTFIGSKTPSGKTSYFESNSGKIEYNETYPLKCIELLCQEPDFFETENEKQLHLFELSEIKPNKQIEPQIIEDVNLRLKKCTKQTAIISRNDEIDEHNSDKKSPVSLLTDEILIGDETASLENVENIRNKLKLQISSLRARRKGPFIQLQTKIVNCSEYNKKLLNDMEKSGNERVNSSRELMKENPLFTQTNELGFIISDIQGGVKFDKKDNDAIINKLEDKNAIPSSNNIEDDQLVVFDQIGKLTYKEESSFTLNDDKLKTKLENSKVRSHVMRKDDTKIAPFIDSSQLSFQNENSVLENKSPFVSDTLDEFLIENFKLNISYKVHGYDVEEGLKENFLDDGPLPLKQVCKLRTISDEKPRKLRSLKAKTVAQKRKLLEKEKMRELKKPEKLKKTNSSAKKEKSVTLKKEQLYNQSFVLFNNEKLRVKSRLNDECIAKIECRNLMEGKNDNELKYHNEQEKNIVRKQKSTSVCLADSCSANENESSRDTVATVIDDLIRYVEIREIAPSLIKDDESRTKNEGRLIEKLTPIIDSNVSISKKPRIKKSKGENELLRLNCKVVNVELEENQSERKCEKPHCHMGCVCGSLNGGNIFIHHCQLVQCMFNCTCPKENDFMNENALTSPAGTLLSPDTLNCIENIAKKKLARVERQFTQTVIKMKNETIVVGSGRRSKLRRNTKTPVIYSDKVNSDSDIFFTQLPGSNFSGKCTVSLPKLNLSQIIPYCLTHNQYDCYCQGTSLSIPNMSMKDDILSKDGSDDHLKIFEKFTEEINDKEQKKIGSVKEVSAVTAKQHLKKCRGNRRKKCEIGPNHAERKIKKVSKISNEMKNFSPNDCSHNIRGSINSHVESKNTLSGSKKPVRNKRKQEYDKNNKEKMPRKEELDGCARTRALPWKCPKTKTNSLNEQNNELCSNAKKFDVCKTKIQYAIEDLKMLEEAILNRISIEQRMRNVLVDKIARKRKQLLRECREDNTITSTSLAPFNENGVIQCRKLSLVSSGIVNVKSVFNGEIIADRNRLGLLTKIGPKTVKSGSARLLPWKVLIESFTTGKINIWSMMNRPKSLYIGNSNKRAPKNYVNIKTLKKTAAEQTTDERTEDVISWILNGRLPECYQPDNFLFILQETKKYYEICGVCTRNISSRGMEEEKKIDNPKDEIFIHRNINGNYQLLNIFKKNYQLQELVEESTGHLGGMSDGKDKLYMWAALPKINPLCKWRMIHLNSDFMYLYLVSVGYSINYTDLKRIGEIAENNKCTVKGTIGTLKRGYDHVEFGIYFDPSYVDKIFIGPYFKHYTGNDVAFVNMDHISAEHFNGKKEYKCGHWLIEPPNSKKGHPIKKSIIEIMDLTKKDGRNDIASKVLNYWKKHTSVEILPHKVIMYNREQILILNAPLKKPEEFNLYITSNIPHFGYLGAYRHFFGEIDVSWPSEEKLLRFSNIAVVIDFLQDLFSALLQPVPETFKINIKIETEVDFENTHSIDATVLRGYYICGDFGFENIITMTNDDCLKKTGKPKAEILSMVSKRTNLLMRKRLENLASLLNMCGDSGHDI
ncbi:uncharacterized protein [Leptinotarsa decemlineata]|uniref:uncharacterized protein n=1 Tax=Leptinotarsa decemlineata TaxID=7539 RepID=UPI003D307065